MSKKTKDIEETNEIIADSQEDEKNLEERESEKFILKNCTEKITLNYASRGFKSEKQAREFVNTNYFKGLCEADKEEFLNWLENK